MQAFNTTTSSHMREELEHLRELIDRQRADLAATNTALLAVFSAIPHVYRGKVLEELAHLQVHREQLAEQIPNPEMQVAAERINQAQERLWKVLQEADKRAEQSNG